MWAFKNVESENIMLWGYLWIEVGDKNIFKKLKLFKMIFEAEMPLLFFDKILKK